MDVPPPHLREIRRRIATRLVVLSHEAEPAILLFEDSDPGVAGQRWWVTPGGGIDPGEDEVDAGVRELGEETGWRANRSDLIGPLSVRRTAHGYSDQILVQRETFFGIVTPRFEVDTAGHTEDEKLTLQSWRWWPLSEIRDPDARIWPRYLPELVALMDAVPSVPVDHGDQMDESTVPIDPEHPGLWT